jgi:ribose transport system substrate-binding protein
MKKVLSLSISALLLLGLFVSCAPEAAEVAEPAAETEVEEVAAEEESSEVYRVGLIPPALVSPFYIVLADTAQELADAYPDVDLTVQDPTVQTAIEEQVKIIEDMIEKQVDLIAIASSNWDAVAPSLMIAREAGIEVVFVDRVVPFEGLDAVSMLGSDEIEGGQFVGEFVAETLEGAGKVAVLTGVAGSYHSERRLQGFNEIMENYPDVEIVTIQPANWQRELGMTTMENILQSNPDLDLVWGLNDNMALGALTAVQAANLQDQIKVVGYNGDQEALENVKAGTMLATAKSQPMKIAEAIMNEVVALLMAGNRDEVQSAYPIHVVLTTVDNVDQFLTE